jgi:predicted permease
MSTTIARRIRRRLRTILQPARVASEIENEMRAHIELEAEELMRGGMAAEEARRRASVAFGGVDRYTEAVRDAWPLRWAQRVLADVRFAWRSLLHTPAFTITAVVALALGIGANATVFGAVDSVAIRPLAVREPDALYAVYGEQGEANLLGFSYPAFSDLRQSATAFTDFIAFVEGPVTVGRHGGDDAIDAVWAVHTSDNYFTTLGVTPVLGTFYQPGELASPVVVLSDALWSSRFGRDRNIVGNSIRVNGRSFSIAGVAPPQFTGTRLFTHDPALWIPVGMHAQTIPSSAGLLTSRSSRGFHLVGRVRPGLTAREAKTTVERVARDLARVYPEQHRDLRIDLIPNRTPINPWLAPPQRIALIGRMMLIGCLLVLVVACVNVSSLLIARMTFRRQEMSVRLSLGASRGRLVQQLLTESVLLAFLGTLVAVPVYLLTARGLLGLFPSLEYSSSVRPAAEVRVLLFGMLLMLGTALFFGLAPALQASGRGIASVLRERGSRGGRRWAQFREALVVGQALVSALILAAGGLFARSLQHARGMDPGFALDQAWTFTMNPELSPAYDAARTRELYRRVVDHVAMLPGVRSVGRATAIPLDGSGSTLRIFVNGQETGVAAVPVAELNVISPGFLSTLGTPMLAGREFTAADTLPAVGPVIVNEVLARRVSPNESAIGKQLRLNSPGGPLVEVVGIARTSMYRTLGERPRPAIWLNLDRNPRSRTTILVRTSGSAAGLVAPIRRVAHDIDPELPLVDVRSLRSHVSVAYTSVENGAVGALALGALGLLLAATGIYGVTAYAVSQRRREIGIRIALGARGASVVRLVAGRAFGLTAAGALAGGLVVAFVPMGLDTMLHGVAQRDLLTLTIATVLFSTVAGAAAVAAARRSVRDDPMTALRVD